MNLTFTPSSSLQTSRQSVTKKPFLNQALTFSGKESASAERADQIELSRLASDSNSGDLIVFGPARKSQDSDRIPLLPSHRNSPQASARAQANWRPPLLKAKAVSRFQSSVIEKLNNRPTNAHSSPELSIPIVWNPNPRRGSHQYLSSPDPETNKVFGIINDRIAHSEELQKQVKSIPEAQTDLKLFAKPEKAAWLFKETQKAHDALAVKLLRVKKNNNKELERELYRDVYNLLDVQMGDEFYLDTKAYPSLEKLLGDKFYPDKAYPSLEKLLKEQLGYAQTRKIQNKDDRKTIQDWRVKKSLHFFSDEALKIESEWAGWGISAGVALVWALTVGTFGANHRTENILQSELKKTEGYQEFVKAHSKGYRLFVGLPNQIFGKALNSASVPKRINVAATDSAVRQGIVELPDLFVVNGLLKAATTRGLSLMQGISNAVKENWLSSSIAVLNASAWTMPNSYREANWQPESWAGKLGKGLTGLPTEYVSLLACAQPYFTTSWNIKQSTSQEEAQRWYKHFEHLSEQEIEDLKKCSNPKAVKNFFENRSQQEILPYNPTSRIAAASLPLAAGMVFVPTIIDGAVEFIPDTFAAKEWIKFGMGIGWVPWKSAAEAFSSSAIGAMDSRYPDTVTKMAKVGQYGIDTVHWPFQKASRGVSSTWNWLKGNKAENPDQVYVDLYNRMQGEAAGT